MRRVILILFTLLALPFVAQAKGVTYFKGTVYQALDHASRNGKLLLVEFHADWNYKSRWMRENTILKSDLDDHFVVVAVETTSVDGAKLARMYEVKDYPNLLIFDKNGGVIDRIDRTMTLEDFTTRLSQVRLSVDGYSALQLRKIFTAASNGDNEETNALVQRYFNSLGARKIDVHALSDLFSSKSINYYGSVAFDYMITHREQFDTTFVKERVRDLSVEALIPYVAGTEPFDSIEISRIVKLSHEFGNVELIQEIANLAMFRNMNQAAKFIHSLDLVIKMVATEYQYPLILSLDFVDANLIDRSVKRIVNRMLEYFTSNTPYDTKNVVIQSLIDKFM